MPEDTSTEELSALLTDLAKYGVGSAGAQNANAITQDAYKAIIANLKDRFGEYQGLAPAGYKQIEAEKLGRSGLEGIQVDPQSRLDEQAAIAAMDNIAKSGGLTLADKAALDKLERTLSRNAGARNASIANQFAARGQLGGGQQLAMQLDAAQNATEHANEAGENTAAQAQKRAMDAVLEKGKLSHSMSSEDYARKARAAEAEDAIARFNASMSMDAAKSNNDTASRAYNDALHKLSGENAVTGNLNTALLGSGTANANTAAGQAFGAAGLVGTVGAAAGKALKGLKGAGGGGSNSDSGEPNPDETGGRGGAADLSGGSTDTEEPVTTTTTSEPAEWEQWNG